MLWAYGHIHTKYEVSIKMWLGEVCTDDDTRVQRMSV